MPKNSDHFQPTIDAFDALNAEDPAAKELLYSQRMSATLSNFAPDAPESVQLAVRAQHICRWKIPRESYPATREGYRNWRKDLGAFHAETAARVMRTCGYDDSIVDEVSSILRKERLKSNPSTQLLEDVACLVFLEHYFPYFAAKHDEEKILHILRRTWAKMSDAAHDAALAIQLSDHLSKLVIKALSSAA